MNNNMRNLLKNFIILFLVFLALTAVFSFLSNTKKETEQIGISELVQLIGDEQIEKIVVEGDKIKTTLTSGEEKITRKEPRETFSEMMSNFGVDPARLAKISIEVKEDSSASFWMTAVLPFLLPFLLIVGFIWFMMRQVQGANTRALSFGQSQVRDTSKGKGRKVTFKDVAGLRESKEELKEVVEFLRNPKKFLSLGAKIPKGVLLVGAPGTGKTLLARAVAGEANAPFFHLSGSEFVEMFVGVGAARVRDLFRKAKKAAPCIVFIDEIDAVGRQRGAGLGGSHDEREQTLNQILVEMDGFETHTNIIVMAATNRPDVLDPALLRPGRFDRRVMLDLPDINDRYEILKIHARNKPFEKDVDLRRVAQRTPGFSGADLENLLNEAALLAARYNKKRIAQSNILESIEKVVLGPERKSRVISEKEKKITAYHEAAHALVAHILPHTDPVQKVSIISRGRAGGYTLKMPTEDRYYHTTSEFLEDISVMLAGHAVEKEVFGEVTTGASNDLKQATKLARSIVAEYGMSEKLGPRTFGQREEMVFLGKEIHERRDYSEKTAEMIDKEIMNIIEDSYSRAKEILHEHRSSLEIIVKKLMEKETLEREEFEALFA